jgi:hypothetical protein
MRRLLRWWAPILAVLLWGLAWAVMRVIPAEATDAPFVRIRWAVNLADRDRIALEEQFQLVQGQFVQETVWSYAILDESDDHAHALLKHPSVVDTDGFDRNQFVLKPGIARVPVPAEVRFRWAAYWRMLWTVVTLAAIAVTAIALRRHPRWLLAYSGVTVVGAALVFWPIGSGESKTTLAEVLKQEWSELRRPGWEATFTDDTLIGPWVTLSAAPCQDGPGVFSMQIKPDSTMQITSTTEGTRVYRIEEWRRAAVSPRAWERGSVLLAGVMEDGTRVHMLWRQSRPNILEPIWYERQGAGGGITRLNNPPPLVHCN